MRESALRHALRALGRGISGLMRRSRIADSRLDRIEDRLGIDRQDAIVYTEHGHLVELESDEGCPMELQRIGT